MKAQELDPANPQIAYNFEVFRAASATPRPQQWHRSGPQEGEEHDKAIEQRARLLLGNRRKGDQVPHELANVG
jgi:hypothetical protein